MFHRSSPFLSPISYFQFLHFILFNSDFENPHRRLRMGIYILFIEG